MITSQQLLSQSSQANEGVITHEIADLRGPAVSLAWNAPAFAGTFIYVSNAEDGDIGIYTLQAVGSLQPGPRVTAAKIVMPMVVSCTYRKPKAVG
jgi:hypothetical protein